MKLLYNGNPVDGQIVTLPAGGGKGQVLAKRSDADYDFCWAGEGIDAPSPTGTAKIYGVTWDDPKTTKLRRTDDAKDFIDPIPADDVSFELPHRGYSPFDNIMPWAGMKKVIDGEIAEDEEIVEEGNVLVSIPKYYVKVTHNPFTIQISSEYQEGFQVSPAHRDRQDGCGERDVVYIGRYECDDAYMSRSGRNPKTDTTREDFRVGIAALGDDYWQADYAIQLTLWYLYLVEFADWDGQAVIGDGHVGGGIDYRVNTGTTDSMIYHTGSFTNKEDENEIWGTVQYRWVENPWGNVSEWRDGICFHENYIYTYNNPSSFRDSGIAIGLNVRSEDRIFDRGWIKAWGHDQYDPSFIFPSETGEEMGEEIEVDDGLTELKIGGTPDYYVGDYSDSEQDYGLIVGGSFQEGANAGLFYLNIIHPESFEESIGSRLMKLPQVQSVDSTAIGTDSSDKM